MLDVIFILLIFVEISLTYYIVGKIIVFENKINTLNKKVTELKPIVEQIHSKIRSMLEKANRVARILTNKKLLQAKKIIFTTIEIIQIIILLKSLDFSKGLKFNFKSLRKLAFNQSVRYTINKLINFVSAV